MNLSEKIKRREFLKKASLGTAALILPKLASSQISRPNVIFVLTDDQGYGDLGCHGNEIIKTPNLDWLHHQSMRLTNFHVSPSCAPTRASLMTGRYNNRTGVWHTIMGRSLLREDEVTIADVLKNNGYKTGIFGKWHLGDNYPFRPQDRGFDEVLIHGGGGIGQAPDSGITTTSMTLIYIIVSTKSSKAIARIFGSTMRLNLLKPTRIILFSATSQPMRRTALSMSRKNIVSPIRTRVCQRRELGFMA